MTVNQVFQTFADNYPEIFTLASAVVAFVWSALRGYSSYAGARIGRKRINNESAALLADAIDKWSNNQEKGHYKLVVEQAFFSLFGRALSIKEILFLVNFESLETRNKIIKYYQYLICNTEEKAVHFKYPATKLKHKTVTNVLYFLSLFAMGLLALTGVFSGFLAYTLVPQNKILLVTLLIVMCAIFLTSLIYLTKQLVYRQAALKLANDLLGSEAN